MPSTTARRRLGVLLFPGFELLDVCGPLEMFGNLGDACTIVAVAERAGPVASSQSVRLHADHDLDDCPDLDLLLVPGGIGTRREVENTKLVSWLAVRGAAAEMVLSVCTGAALLARAGLLDGRPATTNKRAFSWVVEQGPAVHWVEKARWVDDGAVVTSSGVTAGIDMALAVVERLWGIEVARAMAERTEYERHTDPDWDPFAALYGLGD